MHWRKSGVLAVVMLLALAGCSGAAAAATRMTPSTSAASAVTSEAGSAVAQRPGEATRDSVAGPGGGASPSIDPNPDATSAAPSSTKPSTPPPGIAESPISGAASVNPTAAISAIAIGGSLTGVTLTNPAEKLQVAGAFNADKTVWHATEPLGYGKSYRLTATAVGADGQTATQTSAFTTLTPGNLTMPYLDYTGGYPLESGATYGVGIVPVVHFDEPISDKAAAQAALQVTATPAVSGTWYWADSQNVYYRPQSFWPAGTTVAITAHVYGVEVGPGLYGQADVSTSFTIGRRQVTVADDNAPKVDTVTVYDGSGAVVRSMNTSMGKHGGETVNGKYINFYTPGGTYLVLSHSNPEVMSSASYGLPADAPGGYAPEPIYYSTRISTDGIFLHELDNTVWAQNNGYDVSHGCLNLDKANAVWFYQHSLVGDPVVIHGAKGAPTIGLWEGGVWSVPWSTWQAGSAL